MIETIKIINRYFNLMKYKISVRNRYFNKINLKIKKRGKLIK